MGQAQLAQDGMLAWSEVPPPPDILFIHQQIKSFGQLWCDGALQDQPELFMWQVLSAEEAVESHRRQQEALEAQRRELRLQQLRLLQQQQTMR